MILNYFGSSSCSSSIKVARLHVRMNRYSFHSWVIKRKNLIYGYLPNVFHQNVEKITFKYFNFLNHKCI